MIAISMTEQHEFVLLRDRRLPAESPSRTVWLLRSLTRKERTALENLGRTVDGSIRVGSLITEAVRAGLVGWRNLVDAAGQPVEFRAQPTPEIVLDRVAQPVANALLDRIPDEVLTELANEIQTLTTISVHEGKG